jgi:hypothetical protein
MGKILADSALQGIADGFLFEKDKKKERSLF